MSGVQDFSYTAAANTTIDGINIAELCPAANINNAIRALMSDVMQELAYQGEISASVSMSLAGVGWRTSIVSGSASIIHVGTGRAGLVRILRWGSPSTLVGSANIITDGGGNIVTATNDVSVFTSFGGGAWRVDHDPASGVTSAVAAAIAAGIPSPNNLIINGGMQINQRVVTTGAADDTYINDRFYILTQTSTITISQLSNPTNGVPSAVRLTQAQAGAQRMGVAQIVESVNCRNVRGQAVASNWWVTSSTSQNIRYAILEWTGTADTVTSDVVLDWTSGTYTAGNFFLAANLTVTQVGVMAVTAATPALLTTITGTCGSSVNNLIVFVWTESTCAQNVALDLSEVQCAPGSSLGAFVWPQQPEVLVQCQRYFQTNFAVGTAPAQSVGSTAVARITHQLVAASTGSGVLITLPVEMRAQFTAVLFNPSAANAEVRNTTTGADCSASSVSATGPKTLNISYTTPGGSAVSNALSVYYTLAIEL